MDPFLPASIRQMLGSRMQHCVQFMEGQGQIQGFTHATSLLPIENSAIFPTNTQIPSLAWWGWNPGLWTWLAGIMLLNFQPSPTEPLQV